MPEDASIQPTPGVEPAQESTNEFTPAETTPVSQPVATDGVSATFEPEPVVDGHSDGQPAPEAPVPAEPTASEAANEPSDAGAPASDVSAEPGQDEPIADTANAGMIPITETPAKDPQLAEVTAVLTAGTYIDGARFDHYTTPNGWTWHLSTNSGLFLATKDDLSRQEFSQDAGEDLASFKKYLDVQYPADVSDPFTGESLASRLNRGVEGSDWTKPANVPPVPNTPSVKIDLDYQAFLNALAWFPQELSNIGGKLFQDSDLNKVHVLVHHADDFKQEWSPLVKKEFGNPVE